MDWIKDKDFIEIDFTGTIKNSDKVFDTSLKETAKKEDLFNKKQKYEPLKLCVGQGMTLKGLDEAFVEKEVGKEYKQEINPENAFGKRNKDLVKVVSMKVFREKNINPRPGMFFDLNNMIARIASVSGGRVIIDFNHPLAGKQLVYKFKINKKISELKEKVRILFDFFSGLSKMQIPYEVSVDNKKAIIKFKEKNYCDMIIKSDQFTSSLKKKFKEILNLGLEFVSEEKKPENKGKK